jgi:4-diphosphocytidyl-2-C-methyl-D-erythritol kinase
LKQKLKATNLLAPAKVNLTLHVIGQQEDGLHLLDSLVTFPNIGDTLSFLNSEQSNLSITSDESINVPTNNKNLILKAAGIINSKYSRSILLKKILPIAAGIGGGSADAAATIRDAISLGYKVSSQDIVKLGADVLACLESQPLRMTGIGDQLKLINPWPRDGYIILVNPRVPLATKKVFAALEQKNNRPMPPCLPLFSTFKELVHFVKGHRNDLEDTAIKLEPIIQKVLFEIGKNKNCLISRMSGSGPTCFGLFENYTKAYAAKLSLMKDFPNWWIISSELTVKKSDLGPF